MLRKRFRGRRRSLREIIETAGFRESLRRLELALPIVERTDRGIITIDLGKEKNLLVAGATDSGKTEFLYCVIASLALTNPPDRLNLLLDDVTRVEFSSFNGLPHLIRPAVVYVEDSLEALRWLENEAALRNETITTAGAGDIRDYNRQNSPVNRIPYLVVVVYELSDLMIGFPGVAEPLICRLAETGPDTGIHLVLATQRPEPKVFTERLRTSIPARICFSTVSRVDSEVALGMGGAEKLKEEGEMLYLGAGESIPVRLRGFSISDEEIDNLTSKTVD